MPWDQLLQDPLSLTPPIKPVVASHDDVSNFEYARRTAPPLTPAWRPPLPSPRRGETQPHPRAARRKYPDSAEGSTQAIDSRDQALFEDF